MNVMYKLKTLHNFLKSLLKVRITGFTKPVLSPLSDLFYIRNTTALIYEHTIKFHSQGLSGLLLLADFPKVSSKPYKLHGDLANHEMALCGCTTLWS